MIDTHVNSRNGVIANPYQTLDGQKGAALAVYAIEDSLCVVHAPYGCLFEHLFGTVRNDYVGDSHRAMMTNLREEDFIFGAEQKVANIIRRCDQRRQPAGIVVVPGLGAALLCEDLPGTVDSLRDEVGARLAVISPDVVLRHDMFDGYSGAMAAFAEQLVLEPEAKRPRSVNIVGYFFTRYEMDDVGSVQELRRLLGLMGVEVVSVFMGGESLATLERAGEAEMNLVLPYGREAASVLEERFGQPSIEVDLPVGVTHSCQFLRKVGEALGLQQEAERVIGDEITRVGQMIQSIMHFTRRKRYALFVDPAKTPGMITYLEELGMLPALVSLGKRGAELEEAVKAELDRQTALYSPCRVIVDPTREEAEEAMRAAKPDVVLGSVGEVLIAQSMGIPAITVTFPACTKRVFHHRPQVGFTGAVILAEDLGNALPNFLDRVNEMQPEGLVLG